MKYTVKHNMNMINLFNQIKSSEQKSRSLAMQQNFHRVVAILMFAFLCIGAWAADYVFYNGTVYMAINNSGTLVASSSFDPSICIWSGTSGGKFYCNGHWLGQQSSSPYTPIADGSYSNTTINSSGYIVDSSDWYYHYTSSKFSTGSSQKDYSFKAYLVTTSESTKVTHIEGIDGTNAIGKAGTYNYSRIGDARVNTSAYTSYDFNNKTYYKVGDNITQDAPTGEEFTYTWSATCSDASYSGYTFSNAALTITDIPETDKEITITLTATKDGQQTQTVTKVVNVSNRMPTGIDGSTVTLNDYEDHTWTYYQSDDKLPEGYPTGYLNSPNPRNVKITYYGNGKLANLKTDVTGVKVGIDANANTFIYYKTIENNNGYKYTTIPNPFSVRPKIGNNYYGFVSWRVKSVTGGTITGKEVGSTINAETEITFVPTSPYTINCTSMEVELEAVWDVAEVSTNGTFNKGYDSVERNFYVITSSANSNITALNIPCTYTSLYPNGTTNGTTTATNVTVYKYGGFTANADSKIEYIILRNNNSIINGNKKNFTIGRGVSGYNNGVCATTLEGMSSSGTNSFRFRIESGTYTYLYFWQLYTIRHKTN